MERRGGEARREKALEIGTTRLVLLLRLPVSPYGAPEIQRWVRQVPRFIAYVVLILLYTLAENFQLAFLRSYLSLELN
ncbi:hypothetical protein BDW69DRAFT_21934 [Aspergillus filifer]